jgi:hypothetical protein
MMHRTRVLPGEYGSPGWWALLPAPPPSRRLTRDVHADWLVLGAGVTGLAIAGRLAELRPDDRIAVVEAQRVGYGSSDSLLGSICKIMRSPSCSVTSPARMVSIIPSISETVSGKRRRKKSSCGSRDNRKFRIFE